MDHAAEHRAEQGEVGIAVSQAEDSGDPTHVHPALPVSADAGSLGRVPSPDGQPLIRGHPLYGIWLPGFTTTLPRVASTSS